MKLSSDTLGGTLIAPSSGLRYGGMGEILAIGWWFDTEEMPQRKPKIEAPVPIPTARPSLRNSPWLIGLITGIVGCVVGGFIVATWQSNQSHNAEDLKRDINLEVHNQVAAMQTDVGHQIQEFQQHVTDQLTAQDEKVSRIQGLLGVSRNKTSDGLQKFASMKDSELRKNLPALTSAVKMAQEGKVQPSLNTVLSVQNRIGGLNLDSPESVQAAEAVINYTSHLREISNLVPDVALARVARCRTPPGVFIDSTITGCTVDLDGQSFNNVAFENCIVRYRGGPVYLRNVTFTNCLYMISLPTTLSEPAKKMVRSILSASGQKPSVTVTSG